MNDKNKVLDNKLISSNTVREILADISVITLRRWSFDENYSYLNFPKPIKVATRNYWRLGDIENWVDEQGSDINN